MAKATKMRSASTFDTTYTLVLNASEANAVARAIGGSTDASLVAVFNDIEKGWNYNA